MDSPFFKELKLLRYSKLIISGGYCSGKTLLIQLLKQKLGIPKLIDHTTRKMRKGEIDGFPYYFISRQEFEKNLAMKKYYDWVEFCGNYYGVLKEDVFGLKAWSLDTLATTWVDKYKNKVSGTYGIFLQSPSEQVILKRAKDRGDNIEESTQRLLCEKPENITSFNLVLPADLNVEKKLNLIIRHITKK